MCAHLLLLAHLLLPGPLLERYTCSHVLTFLAQNGAGLYVSGVANLDGCNVFSNEAQVRADRAGRPFPDLTSSAPLERYTCSPSWHSMELGSMSSLVA